MRSMRNWYRSPLAVLVWVSLAVAPGAAWAQQIFELEGKINGIDAAARTITVMDIVVHVPEGLSIDTPTGSIPLSGPGSLSDPALPSLVGVGTAIIYTPADVPAPFRDYVVIIGRTLIEDDELTVRGFGTFPGTTVSVFRAADDCSPIGAAVATETVSTVDGRWRAVNVPVSGDFPNVLARTTDGATYCVGADRR